MAAPVVAKVLFGGKLFRWIGGLAIGALFGILSVFAGIVMIVVMLIGGAFQAQNPAAGTSPGGPGGGLGSAGWANPGVGSISDGYGPREPICGSGGCSSGFHKGTDIDAGCDDDIRAARDGTVTSAGPNGTYGNWVLLTHGGSVDTGYAHIRDGGLLVTVGQQVKAGQVIAHVGTTGASTGCHLHFEVRIGGERTDPQTFMTGVGITLGVDP